MINSVLEPMACRVARDLIKQGSDLEAFHTLHDSPERSHRSARQLLSEIQPRLIRSATQAAEAGLWPRAVILIEGASLCGDLTVEEIALKERIQSKHQEAIAATKRIEQAMEWASQGRVVSAVDLIRPLDSGTLGQDFCADLEERLSRGERYLDEAAELLELGLLPAAKEKIDRARTSHCGHIKLVTLEDRYWSLMNDKSVLQSDPKDRAIELCATPLPVAAAPTTSTRIPSRFLINDELLIVTSEEAVIGNPRGKGVTVPLLANLHSRHLMIVRHRKEYQAMALPGCPTQINGQPLNGTRILANGDILQLGASSCQFRFCLPVATSMTAVFASIGSARIALKSRGSSQHKCSRFVMLADNLILSPDEEGHLSHPDLPARSLKLTPCADGMRIDADEAEVFDQSSVGFDLIGDSPLTWPSQLQVRTTVSEVELIRRCLMGKSTSDEMTLSIQEV